MNSDKIFTPDQVGEVLKMVRPYFRFAYSNKKYKYFNVPCAFDIETSSFYEYPDSEEYFDPDIYNCLKGKTIKVNQNIKSDFPDFAELRRKYFGIVFLSEKKGADVDSLYEELSAQYPYYFPQDVYNPADRLQVIFDVIDLVRPKKTSAQEKIATMYIWQFGIFGAVIVGRTWEEFISVINYISNELKLDNDKRLLIYVHNLGYEFEWIKDRFPWKKVFAVSSREPVYALTYTGIEFRCSYILSGYSLAKLGEELHTYKVSKLDSLDYELLRNSKTVLSPEELQYCVNDVRVVMAFIQESIEHDGNIARIPLTKTGYARNYVRNNCFYTPGVSRKHDFKRLRYRDFISKLTIEPDEYMQMKRGFQGGFNHTNPFRANKIIEDVTSFDFTSSYPAVMIAEQFPMSKGELVEIDSITELEKNLNCYWCLFDIELFGLESIVTFDSYISRSRCAVAEKAVINNGRLVAADRIITTITGEDFSIIRQMYKWSKARIFNFRHYKRAYLPTDIVKSIIKLYKDKTTLKGVEGKEVEYQVSKGLLNSTFGMFCTDICRSENLYQNGKWIEQAPDIVKALNKYNKSSSRFSFFAWGVAITSYARRNLFSGILEFREDYCYSDTDSIKVVNADKHKDYIERYNKWIIARLERAMDYHGIDRSEIAPKTIKGESKPLGVWDFDGHYKRAKFLGAKRYMVEYDSGEISLTVSGLNKKTAIPYLLDTYGREGIFDAFSHNLYIPPDHTGKMTHTYIDEPKSGTVTDYQGNTAYYNELSSVHLSKQDYCLSISRDYADYLSSIIYI